MFSIFRKRKPPVPAKTRQVRAVPPRMIEIVGNTMGTTYQVRISTAQPLDEDELAASIHAAVDLVDRQMSTWKPDSDLSRFNASKTDVWVPVPKDLARVVKAALGVSKSTQGAFDVTMGAAVNAWEFGPDGSAKTTPDQQPLGVWQHLEVRDAPPALRKSASPKHARLVPVP